MSLISRPARQTIAKTQPKLTAQRQVAVELALPPNAMGLLMVVNHGGAESRSPYQALLGHLQRTSLATVSIESLTPGLEPVGRTWVAIIDWAHSRPETEHLPIGMLALGNAMSAGLVATALRPALVRGVVIVGGRECLLHEDWLRKVTMPLMLITSRGDRESIDSSFYALDHLKRAELVILDESPWPATTLHTFVEATNLTRAWFGRCLAD